MQSAYRFLVVIVLAVFLNDAFASADANQTPLAGRGSVVCNLIQDSHVHAAIKNLETKLETKLENLIALVSKKYPPQPELILTLPQPTPPRKSLSLLICSILVLKHSIV